MDVFHQHHARQMKAKKDEHCRWLACIVSGGLELGIEKIAKRVE